MVNFKLGTFDDVDGTEQEPTSGIVPKIATEPALLDIAVAVRELLGFPIWLINGLPSENIKGLPRACTLVCKVGPSGLVAFTNAQAPYAAARALGVPCFSNLEVTAIALSVENERHRWKDWLKEKLLVPDTFELTMHMALGAIVKDEVTRSWTCQQVFSAIEVELIDVGFGAEIPPLQVKS